MPLLLLASVDPDVPEFDPVVVPVDVVVVVAAAAATVAVDAVVVVVVVADVVVESVLVKLLPVVFTQFSITFVALL